MSDPLRRLNFIARVVIVFVFVFVFVFVGGTTTAVIVRRQVAKQFFVTVGRLRVPTRVL